MAITTNTTKSMSKASTVLGVKCEATQKNLDKLCRDAGCEGTVKKVLVPIPASHGVKDDVIFIAINGAKFYFQCGKSAYVPEPVLMQGVNCGLFPEAYLDMIPATKTTKSAKE